ncbi:MAG: hypothetical protein Fur0044_30960 [Anaerolineae bacterium]|nr:hypothetical protein [Anaerolineae bacterium]
MPEFVLTALDVTGIQRYIFASNRLQENIGASELVFRATNQYAFWALPQECNVLDRETGLLDEARHLEKDNSLVAEVMYAGGGNVLILFRSLPQAQQFVSQLSKKLIEVAPGLELLAAHVLFDWDKHSIGGLEGVRAQVLEKLNRVKHERSISTPLQGLGVTVACQSTGLAAVALNPLRNNQPVAAPVAAKLEAVKDAHKRLSKALPQIKPQGYRIPFEFDKFGRSEGEISYIAVVHADGNNMGAQVDQLAQRYAQPGTGNRAYIAAIREFSQKINEAALAALQDTVKVLLAAISEDQQTKQKMVAGVVPLQGRWLPFRPLVFGGDDVTFVCDGRLGLHLAVEYLAAFERRSQELSQNVKTEGLNLAAHACAGIAVVKSHYPFARAYSLAEQLCSSAKSYVRLKGTDFSALDWHFAASGLLGSLNDIRRSQYEVKTGKLYLRPVRLQANGNDWRTWPNFSQVTLEFKNGDQWADKKNKVIKLRQALREGPVAVAQFLRAYPDLKKEDLKEENSDRSGLPAILQAPHELTDTGWTEGPDRICGYFDAIEAADFFTPLKAV